MLVQRFDHAPKVSMHNHECFEIVYVEQGFAMHRAGETSSLLIPGDVLLLPPWISHEYWKSINNHVYNCMFYTEILNDDLTQLVELPLLDLLFNITQNEGKESDGYIKFHVMPSIRQEALGILKTMERELAFRLDGWKLRSKSLLVEFLVLLSRSYTGKIKSSSEKKSGYAQPIFDILQALESSIEQKLSIEQLANRAGFSSEHFSRTFKKITGLSPSTYMLTMKVAAAAEKLLITDSSITQIAESVGFTDLNYFSRVFKQETGKTPSDFRRVL